MADQVILQVLDGSADGERIVDEFERVTGLQADVRGGDRYYELGAEDHQTRIVQTLTEIDAGWTDHIGLKLPG